MSHADYVFRHRAALEAALSAAVYDVIRDRADDPVAAIGRRLLILDSSVATRATPAMSSSAGVYAGRAGASSHWTLLECVKMANVDAAVAAALRRHAGDGTDALEFLGGLNDEIDRRKSPIFDLGEAVVNALAQLGRTTKPLVCAFKGSQVCKCVVVVVVSVW